MKSVISCIAALICCTCVNVAGAAAPGTYPDKPIRLIVPFPPGGGTDILTRMVANKLTELQGWQFVIDNRSGAGGNIGLELAAKATADGGAGSTRFARGCDPVAGCKRRT